MAHFAQIDENNIVTQVIVVDNNDTLDSNGIESESVGQQFCSNLLGGTWLQTSYNGSIRKNFAGIGLIYDADRDAFIGLQPYPSWVLNEETCIWSAPEPYPEDDLLYKWNEELVTWELFVDGE